jgi:hypothetical protein
MTEENREQRIAIANGLDCPRCDRAIRPNDFELINESAFQIVCQGCHLTVIKLEG